MISKKNFAESRIQISEKRIFMLFSQIEDLIHKIKRNFEHHEICQFES
jgi:hypothetical protein